MKAIIVAMDKNNAIGADNDMPWQRGMRDDMARFKQMTTGASVIMGRKTFETMGRPLPNRENIIVSRESIEVDGAQIVTSLNDAYSLATHEDIFVVGGGQIYGLAINDMDVLYVTEVDARFPEATVFFPSIDTSVWREVSREHHDADDRNAYGFDFVTYKHTRNTY